MTRSLFIVSAACSLALACSDDGGDSQVAPDAGPGPDAGDTYEDADWLFETDRLLDVDIDLADADWDFLRFQTRNILEIFGESCATAPAVSPYTYVEATVTVDGERVANVGVRKKGFLGSLDETKPSIKVKFDKFVTGQLLTGTERMTLNNNKQDPSHMNQCLGYDLFTRAGVPAPRCNFARVTVNGQDMGIYTHVESVKKPMLARHYFDNDGNMYEGTLSDFRDGWSATFERKTNESIPPGSEDRSDVQAIIDALALPDAEMFTELDRLVDLEAFYSFWAVESMTSHGDGYTGNNNNFFIYNDPTDGKFTFMPWGADNLFGNGGAVQDPAATRSTLPNRLYFHPPSRARYLERYGEILDSVWDDADLLAEVDRIEALIGSSVRASSQQAFSDDVTALRATLSGREAILRAGLNNASDSDAEPLAAPLCFDEVGPVTGTVDGTYQGAPSTAVTLAATINGAPRTFSSVTAFIGPDDQQPGMSVMYLTAVDESNKDVVFFLTLPDSQVAAGTVPVGEGLVESVIFFTPNGAMDPDEIYFLGGSLVFSAAAATTGSTWQGSLDLRVWDTPFF